MRCFFAVSLSLACLLSFVGASSAQVTLYVTPTNQTGEILDYGAPLSAGDQITFDIAARNDGTALAGLGVSAASYGAAGLEFVSGLGVPQLFADICVPDLGCFGGLDGSLDVRDSLSERPWGDEVQVFNHISLSPSTSTGEGDWGPNGIAGEAQARVIFNVTLGGIFEQGGTIAIGALAEYADAVVLWPYGAPGTAETIWVVPEPGTALLMGLGLLGLATGTRSPRSFR